MTSRKYISNGDSIYLVESIRRRQKEILDDKNNRNNIRVFKSAFNILYYLSLYERDSLSVFLKSVIFIGYNGKPDYNIKDIPQLYRVDFI